MKGRWFCLGHGIRWRLAETNQLPFLFLILAGTPEVHYAVDLEAEFLLAAFVLFKFDRHDNS